ncbi:unnamed protein product [Rotaria magnacalcarata]|uniref:Uncharacterized protein n=1 Tax=Rotaria magnacalcarata TaxID=392030 RepID=A0A816VLL7_9BILA|nr:unnamed protein product [Rotaria magnacalcarata]CAF4017198.1 unnamed protein product [Rotaria magnacalcarata]
MLNWDINQIQLHHLARHDIPWNDLHTSITPLHANDHMGQETTSTNIHRLLPHHTNDHVGHETASTHLDAPLPHHVNGHMSHETAPADLHNCIHSQHVNANMDGIYQIPSRIP